MPFKIVRNDITKMQVDAIVNTANEEVTFGNGIDFAVYQAAGEKELLEARREIGEMNEGDAAITPAFQLPARYIIHAVSPFYENGNRGEVEKLRSCYAKSLKLAAEYHCKSIAFPLISTGSYGYPKEEAMRFAVDEIHAFLLEHDMLIYLVVFDHVSEKLGRKIYPDLEAYIDNHYVSKVREIEYGDRFFGFPLEDESNRAAPSPGQMPRRTRRVTKKDSSASIVTDREADLEDFTVDSSDAYDAFLEKTNNALESRMQHLADPFQEYLFHLIEVKGLTGAEVYNKAIITKQTFSKIRKNPSYHPDKTTAMRLCVGCRLNLDETKDLLARAGYALSPSDKRDIIFSYFIENQVYDMVEIDIALEEHGLPCFIV